jgi:hypothetical protein
VAVLDSGTTPAAKPPMTFAVRETGSLVEKEAADKIRISDLEPRSMPPYSAIRIPSFVSRRLL